MESTKWITWWQVYNKANLRDLVGANGLVNLLKLHSNLWFFGPCDLEIWWTALKNNRAPLLYYDKLCTWFQSHSWIQTGLQSGNAQFGSKSTIFCPVRPRNLADELENNRTPLPCYFKLCASFWGHWWIQTGVTVRKRSIRVKIINFLSLATLKFDGWP